MPLAANDEKLKFLDGEWPIGTRVSIKGRSQLTGTVIAASQYLEWSQKNIVSSRRRSDLRCKHFGPAFLSATTKKHLLAVQWDGTQNPGSASPGRLQKETVPDLADEFAQLRRLAKKFPAGTRVHNKLTREGTGMGTVVDADLYSEKLAHYETAFKSDNKDKFYVAVRWDDSGRIGCQAEENMTIQPEDDDPIPIMVNLDSGEKLVMMVFASDMEELFREIEKLLNSDGELPIESVPDLLAKGDRERFEPEERDDDFDDDDYDFDIEGVIMELTSVQRGRFENIVQRVQKKVEGTFGSTMEGSCELGTIVDSPYQGEEIMQTFVIHSRGVRYAFTVAAGRAERKD